MGSFTDRGAKGQLAPGVHADGDGLYLSVSSTDSRSWIFRGTIKGRTTGTGKPYRVEVGLGSLKDIGLAEAREQAAQMRKQCRVGVNPLDEKHRERQTFEQAARQLHAKEAPTWANSHSKRWLSCLEVYAFPKIGNRPIEDIRRPDVVGVLEPLWRSRHETARKLKIRVAQVIDYATDRGQYHEANPARGTIRSLDTFDRTAVHMAALHWRDLPDFMAQLSEREGVSARALAFAILTCARSGEIRGATWGEIDEKVGVWTVPAERMKARRAHRVPLSEAALAVLAKVRGLDSNLIFPSAQRDKDGNAKIMSDMAFKALYGRMKVDRITTHGFRSTFRDWCSESARADFEIAEAALAHSVGTTVERAYARSDLFERRRDLMEGWARYATGQAGQVVQLVRA
ncbi:phage integrase central domain-containing protein [Tabrizicola sp.]|uniref:tyrosine-type recombinase/integrase n=1 Tax=Tabrizicola sp. TaxID=2005166 RepID=UPI00286C019F|nr:tyrosine-type recombinase/integrase [Tabrizicola sp.]